MLDGANANALKHKDGLSYETGNDGDPQWL
jgi:hypothetical protein